MTDDKPQLQIVQKESNPTNRKELVIEKEMAITQAIQTGNKDRIINTIIDWIGTIEPEIEEYETTNIYELEPSYKEISEKYIKTMKLVIPQLIQHPQHDNNIKEWIKTIYLRRLQKQRQHLQCLLKECTNWYFDDEYPTPNDL